MKINVGDYVRTKGGNIFKIISGNTDNWEVDISCIQLEQTEENWYESNRYNDNGYWFNEENIIKSSPNIIDLIEEDDYVNGSRVIFVDKKDKHITVSCSVSEDGMFYGKDIKSIVTHEQFENMKYKVGE